MQVSELENRPESLEEIIELSDLLIKNRDVQISKAGVLQIDSEKITHKNIEKELAELFRHHEFKKFQHLMFTYNPASRILDVLKRTIKLQMKEEKNSDLRGSDLIRSFSYDDYRPIRCIESNNYTFINTKTNEVANLSYDTYDECVPKDIRKEPIKGKVLFNPYIPRQIYTEVFKNQIITCANRYVRPEWQLDRELTEEERKIVPRLPESIARFMETLFPSAASREFVYDWLHHAVTERCETYLVLNGAKGIGKGLLTDYICKKLMGKENHRIATPSLVDGNKFNAILHECRMIVLDEMPINDHDKIAILKRIINTDQGIEFKNKDVAGTVETYNSFIISSNNLSDIKIEWDDRRFSVMDVSQKKLNEIWTEKEIKALVDDIEDPDHNTIREFGYWLMYRVPKDGPFAVFKGEHFLRLCYSSLPEWSRTIIDEIESGMYDTLDDVTLKMRFKERNPMGRFPHAGKVEDFLKNYKHQGTKDLGTYEKADNGGFIITVSDEFYKGRDSLGIEWEQVSDDLL